jgi:uncharacterized protein VirK/YbjX
MTMTVNCATINSTHALPANSELPARLPVAAQQKYAWSPVLLGSVLWRGFTHIRTHREVLRLLLRFPPYTEFVIGNPSFAYKYLTQIYLVRGFTVAERAACFLHHYQRLHAALPDSLLRRTLREDVAIHEIPEGANRFFVTMGMSRPSFLEGEMSLHLRVDGEIVYVLSFTIVPGWVVKSPAEEILLITRLQGVKGAYPPISYATKTLHDVAPDALLFAALQGIAQAFGIGELAAVSGGLQSYYSEDNAAAFKEAYDDFFTELGIPKSAAGFFRIPLPFQEKPLTFIKHGHKIRTREKRAFKKQIQLACAGFFEKFAPDASRKLPAYPLTASASRG